ncbi:MAG: hypothetical protein MUP15_00420 [Dehalococcoidia bacterium]|nr:hypothetical protein [Dehalococcoidia bacterium]
MIDRIAVWALSLKARASEERGQDIMEYAIITGGIAVILFTALAFFTDDITDFFTRLGTYLDGLAPK